jgi:hypothetical protein
MDTHSNAMRTLARQLLAMEAAVGERGGGSTGKSEGGGERAGFESVCEKLRVELTQFAGAEGFASLLRRALAMARDDLPALGHIKIGPGGILEGLEEVEQTEWEAGALTITANLLDLLAMFIGEPLTLKLVRETWPELPPPEMQTEARPK